MRTKVKENTPINSLLEKHPETAEIMIAYGLHCVGCHFSQFDTVVDGARMHGMPEEEIAMMIKDVNKTIDKNGTKSRRTKNKNLS